MVYTVAQDGGLEYMNDSWVRVLGWTLEEARGIDVLDALFPDTAERARAAAHIRHPDSTWMDFEPLARDGRSIPSSWCVVPMSDGSRLVIGVDHRERRKLMARLAQSEKLEALGQLAAGVAHDFNNMLMVISASSAFIRQAIADASVHADLDEIDTASSRATALTRQLLAFGRQQVLRPAVVDVNHETMATARTLTRIIGENIQLTILARAQRPTVLVDPIQLDQVVLNLAVNARDAIQERGTITLATENETRGCIEYLVLSVTDDGCGIAAAVRDQIFEPFFTTKAVGRGTGLGLATVHGIITQSGGRIEVESEVGKGTTFRVMLPVADGRVIADGETSAIRRARPGATVLYAEDETALRIAVCRTLQSLGYAVLEARHGSDAIAVAATHDGAIDLLLSDVMMPEIGGQELADRIRIDRPDLPVLFMSGYTDEELMRRGLLRAGNRLLRKPFLPVELAAAVAGMTEVTISP
jgi:PAS domain S-box-containing protein